jgi:hypothetical protein
MDPADDIRFNRLAYSEDGVDLTLIRWMLSLTPVERLEVLQQYVDSVLVIRAWNSESRVSRNPASPEQSRR